MCPNINYIDHRLINGMFMTIGGGGEGLDCGRNWAMDWMILNFD